MSRLLVLNFGTFVETNRFKQRALADGFVGTDAMDDAPPGALVKTGGVRTVNRESTTTHSFYGLVPTVWRGSVDSAGPFHQVFEKWMQSLLASPVQCVYLTGHHAVDAKGNAAMYWDDQANEYVFMFMGNATELRFGTFDKAKNKVLNQFVLETKNFRAECRLVVGFGCNVAAPNQSKRYQQYFANGAKPPIVLGWKTTMSVPSKGASVNAKFFDYLAAYAKTNTKVPAKDRLAWFYDNEPMELIRGWGYGMLGLQGTKAKALRAAARARHHDGTYYRFDFKKDGTVEPVKD